MDKRSIIEIIYNIIEEITEKKYSRKLDDDSLFSRDWDLEARDIVYLLIGVKEEFGIRFSSEKINSFEFFTLSSITDEIIRISNIEHNER